jgi:hypothetical protein
MDEMAEEFKAAPPRPFSKNSSFRVKSSFIPRRKSFPKASTFRADHQGIKHSFRGIRFEAPIETQ